MIPKGRINKNSNFYRINATKQTSKQFPFSAYSHGYKNIGKTTMKQSVLHVISPKAPPSLTYPLTHSLIISKSQSLFARIIFNHPISFRKRTVNFINSHKGERGNRTSGRKWQKEKATHTHIITSLNLFPSAKVMVFYASIYSLSR